MDAALPHTPYRVHGPVTPAGARAYCRHLARTHYENFLVTSLAVPRALRPHFEAIYAFCRIADDLADESRTPDDALVLLDWWQSEVDACFAGAPRHPAMVALAETNAAFGITRDPYDALLSAFRQDQTTTRYETYEALLHYCSRSANPVGRLLVALMRCGGTEREALSDATCTALQLANFWQDVARDYARGRLYIPAEDMRRFGASEADIAAGRCTPALVELLRFETGRARLLFEEGAPLAGLVPRRLGVAVAMFTRGGLEVLRRIEAAGFDVLRHRPTVPRTRQLALLVGALAAPRARR